MNSKELFIPEVSEIHTLDGILLKLKEERK